MSAAAPTRGPPIGIEECLDLLGGHVRQRSASQRSVGVIRRMRRFRQIEIKQLRPVIDRQKNIGRLDVAVINPAFRVRSAEPEPEPSRSRLRLPHTSLATETLASHHLSGTACAAATGISSEPALSFPLEPSIRTLHRASARLGRRDGLTRLMISSSGSPG